MKALLQKIRRILKDRRTRQMLTRIISVTAAVVVFVTTYALVLPAITMETEAQCGIEAHQHSDECYTDELVCEIPESPGHAHTDACYKLSQVLVCETPEHEHSAENGCYDEDGNLVCELAEHHHTVDEGCYKEVKELVCDIPESEGHTHDSSCYKKVLTCGKEVHTHSTACYHIDAASKAATEAAAVASTESAAIAGTDSMMSTKASTTSEAAAFTDKLSDDEIDESNIGTIGTDTSANLENVDTTSTDSDAASANPGGESGTWTPAEETIDSAVSETNSGATGSTTSAASTSTTATTSSTSSAAEKATEENTGYVPVLDELNINAVLNNHTGIYYYHPESDSATDSNEASTEDSDGTVTADNNNNTVAVDNNDDSANTVTDGSAIPAEDWHRIPNNTEHGETPELGESDLLRVYLAYTIPAGCLNETNTIARYRLPRNIRLTDAQIDTINSTVNGIAAQYVNMDTLEILDVDQYNASLGIEAVEGTRTPDQDIQDYLNDLEKSGKEASEYINATVRVENVFNEDSGDYEGQDLVFTFTPYSILKNQHEYDKDGQPTRAGEELQGWVSLDLTTDQIEWITSDNDDKKAVEKTADIVFVEKDQELDVDEISTELKLVEKASADDIPTEKADAVDTAETTEGNETEAARDEEKEDNKTEATEDDETAENEKAVEEPAVNYPSVSFDDSITVTSGTLSTDTTGAGAEENTEITVHVEADEDTFPEGTTMRLAAVTDDQMAAVTEAVEGAMAEAAGTQGTAGRTQGFHALDISFWNADGIEIEPLKPIRVSMTSEAIKRAVEDSATAPVVVHVEDGHAADTGNSVEKNATSEGSVAESADDNQDAATSSDSETVDNPESGLQTLPTASIIETETGETKEENTDTLIFEAGAFSVYAIVYTVDFTWEIDGKQYQFNMPGGGFVNFTTLIESMGITSGGEASSEFVSGIRSVVFSAPDLLWVGQAEEDTTVSDLRNQYSLDAEYSASVTPEEIDAINETLISAGDWVLLSIKPFETTETLTVTMDTGEVFTITVTDEQNAPMNPDGQTVQTIPNPSGTTIDMFDYWIDSETEVGRRGWLGYRRSGTTGYDAQFWNYFDNQNTSTNGNNVGINYNHRLKFLPSMGGQVQDWATNGTYYATSQDGRIAGINSWNGTSDGTTTYNGQPTTGIIRNALYNSAGGLDADGYPRLNAALGGESLDYLFNPATSHSGKRSYEGANNLFYVDPDGYYTYNSMDYRASMSKTKDANDYYNFTLRKHDESDTRNGIRGFWPMGDLNYWLGMHVSTDFSMPANGEVLNPKGVYKPMQFEFSGDDDAWAYVDGILVADGGGIHNRTELDINFKTGVVKVIGGRYTDLLNPDMTVVSERKLYDIFTEAHNNGLISNEKWNSYTWVDIDGDGTLDTFAQGTELKFDFFYLERGGGESNLYIHYNLISTTDFSAHKSYHMLQDDPHARLERNQFKFELIGFDNTDSGYEGETVQAVMPTKGTAGGDGTFENPKKEHSNVAPTGAGVPQGAGAHTSMLIGVTEDGNVNFGDVEISSAYAGKSYKYMVREVVPNDAVNADGIRWDAADDELKSEGGFVKDGITYDGKIYYFVGTVRETSEGSGKYELKKTRYTDSTYTTVDEVTKFFSFVNGHVDPLTLKVLKKDETGEISLDGARFGLTRAMQDENGNWVFRTYQSGGETVTSPTRTGITSQGALSFDNLTEGHYILEETVAPTGYEKGDPYRWLLTLTKVDAEEEILLVPSIQGLSSDGTLIGEARQLTTDTNHITEFEVLNAPKQIQLTLNKEWYGEPADNTRASFQLKRYRTYTKPSEVTMVDVYIRYDSDYQSYANNGANTGRHIRVPANARVRFGYSGFNAGNNNYVYPWLSVYVGGSGGGHSEVLVNGRYDTTYTVGTQEVCFWLYANHGNISPTDSRFNFNLEYVEGTGDRPGPGVTVTEEDPSFTAQNITVDLPQDGSWEHQFASYPVMGTNTTYNVPETYTYYIEELDPLTPGYDVRYDRMDGENIAGSTDSETRVITNVKKTDVPVNKTWEWSEADAGRAGSWDATFVLEFRETLVSGEPAPDAQHTWAQVNGVAPLTIHNGDTGDAVSFKDLPMYREHANGSVYRLIYAVDETAYHVYDSGNNLIARWTKDGSESQIGTLYAPDYEQDAGEADQPEDQADWPAWYTISLTNDVHETTVKETIDLAIQKIWEEGTETDEDSYAKFQLKRYVHEEYRDYSKDGIDTSQMVTVTLDLGNGKQKQIEVPKGAPVHISAMAKPGREVNLTFTGPGSTTHTMALDNSGSAKQAIADTDAFYPQSDSTISFGSGNTDALIGGLDGIRLACYYDKQTPHVDTSFNAEHDGHVDQAGQPFTLDDSNHWQKDWVELPQIVEGKLDDNLQTVYVYSYFLEEIESSPEGFVPIFRNSAGEELGDSHIPVDFSTSIIVENEEATTAAVKKVWDDNNSADRPASLTVTLLADGSRTEHTVTLNETNHWEASVGDLPKYNDGTLIDYQWVEEEMPTGYFLTDVSEEETTERTFTTLTNSLSKYDIKTSYVGTKNWSDFHNQYLTRPHELVVKLYADGVLTNHVAEWTEGPGDDQWTYKFSDLPVFTDDGELIHYTAVEEPVPGGYTETHTQTPTEGNIGTITYEDGRDRVTPNNQIVWTLGSPIDLSFVAIKPTANGDVVVWTHRTPVPSEVTAITNAIRGGALPGASQRNIVFYTGTGDVHTPHGDIHVTFDEENLTMTIDFGATDIWSQFIVGQFNKNGSSHYEPGTTAFTNTLQTTELSGAKSWAIPSDIAHADPVLKLTRTTTSIDIDGTEIVSDPEVVQVKVGNDLADLQPEWSGDGATMRNFVYRNLPRYNQAGKEYTYSVEEVSFTIGSGEDAVVYTVTKDAEGSYVVTANKPDAEPYVVTQVGNTIINGPLTASIEIIKVEKGHKETGHVLPGATFKLTRVDADGHDMPAPQDYHSEEQTVDPETGKTIFTGLSPGRYKLEEVKSPDGYNIFESPWYFLIDASGTVALDGEYELASPSGSENSFFIENEPGAALPNTGGPGTRLFTILGSILILGAGLLLWRRRRLRIPTPWHYA